MLKMPMTAPKLWDLVDDAEGQELGRIVTAVPGPLVNGEYVHWDKLFHLAPPDGLTHLQWWLGLKWSRKSRLVELPLRDAAGLRFSYSLVDPIPERLHHIDLGAGGRIEVSKPITDQSTRDRYYVSSLIEEAITSSQIEGAGTTRQVAKGMLRSGRRPADRGERMIYNNFVTMRRIGELREETLTPELVLEIHRLITQDTLEEAGAGGRFRRDDEEIVVGDFEGAVLHRPPPAHELPARLEALCRFANSLEPIGFVHPAIRSIALHFWLAYDHPFVDGNGRTARALFYWSMLHHGFWLFEFISISSVIRKAKTQYLRAFLYTETDENDLTYFLLYHLQLIETAIQSLNDYLRRKMKAAGEIADRVRGAAELNHRQRALVQHAVRHPDGVYTIESHRNSHGVVYQTARADLLDLEAQGILLRRREGKAFVFTPRPDLESYLARKPERPK